MGRRAKHPYSPVMPVDSRKRLLTQAGVCAYLRVSWSSIHSRLPRPLQIDGTPMWTIEQVERVAAAVAEEGKEYLTREALQKTYDAAAEIRDRNLNGGSRDAVTAAVYCMTVASELLAERDRLSRGLAEVKRRERTCEAASLSGFLHRAMELPGDGVPPALREFTGRLIECPMPSVGQPLIYFLLRGDDVVYIGQTVSIETRLVAHLADKAFDRVLAMPVARPLLDSVERELIERFLPPLNRSCIPAHVLRGRKPIAVQAPARPRPMAIE